MRAFLCVKNMKYSVFFLLAASFIATNVIYAEEDNAPKLEVGVLVAGQYLSEYRGSRAEDFRVLPLPFLYYRGDFLKVDRNGARAEFFANDHIEFKLSGEASLNGGGNDTDAREGMPELDSAFELGPSFNINLTGDGFATGLELNFPLRAVVTFDGLDLTHRGYTFNPKFTYKFPSFGDNWVTKLQVGALFGSKEYHEFYYDVGSQFVTPERPLYESEEGFSGQYYKLSLRRRTSSFFYGISLRYDNLDDAVIEDSPLIETRNYFSVSFAFAYIFWTPSI